MYPAELLELPSLDVVCPQQLKNSLLGLGSHHWAPTGPAPGCISTTRQPDPGQERMASGSPQKQQPGAHLSRVVLEDTF